VSIHTPRYVPEPESSQATTLSLNHAKCYSLQSAHQSNASSKVTLYPKYGNSVANKNGSNACATVQPLDQAYGPNRILGQSDHHCVWGNQFWLLLWHIVTALNVDVEEINDRCIDKMLGEVRNS